MKNTVFRVASAILVGGAISAAAISPGHSQSYPRVTGSGMNLEIDYGPMGQGNLVGGGRVVVTQPSGMDVNVMHLDAMFAQQARPGFVPMTIGSGENQETVWVPQAMVDMIRRARAGAAQR
jgi:hypothetical protein